MKALNCMFLPAIVEIKQSVSILHFRPESDYFNHPSHRRDLLKNDERDRVKLHEDDEVVPEKHNTLSQQMRDNLVPFQDNNRFDWCFLVEMSLLLQIY